MRTGKEIDFTHVDFITYAYDDFLHDVPMYDLVSNYVKLYTLGEDSFWGEFEIGDEHHRVVVHKDFHLCYVDDEPYNAEEFVILFEGEENDPVIKIKQITGVDHDDYISDVTYSDGTIELLDVKGKALLIGKPHRMWIKDLKDRTEND